MIDNRMKSVRRRTKDVWYSWYPADYAAKTAHLTAVQDGIYRRLLDHYYLMHGSMLANATILLRVCRAFDAAEQAAVHAMLAEFFVERDGYYRHERADAELEKRAMLREKRAQAGSKGGKQKVANATNLLGKLPPDCQTQSQSQKEEELEPTLSSNPESQSSEAIASEPSGSVGEIIEPTVPKEQPAPVIPIPSPLDFQKELWSRGVSYLKANGVSDSHARTQIGKWRKVTGSDFEVLELLSKAEGEAVSEPMAFIEGMLKLRKGKTNGKANSGQLGRNRQIIDDHPLGNFAAIGDRIRAASEGGFTFDA